MAENDVCKTCGNPRTWHDSNSPVHPFNDGQAGATAFLKRRGDRNTKHGVETSQRGPERPALPFDPVLRQALIDVGVITPQHLRDAEEKIQAVTASFTRGDGNGEGEIQV